jgi:serine/threonine-protein kinase
MLDSVAGDRDERLAQLLADLTEQQRQGHRPEIDVIAQQHPDLAQELRELWAAVQIAEEFAKPISDSQVTIDLGRARRSAEGPRLPRSFGDYELIEEIGRGGMGVVYKAWQQSLNRLVAVKMILRGELASSADLARFRAEAESAARLDHPNIVPVYEVGEHDGQAYFSMQYIEGSTLSQMIAAGPLPAREAASMVRTISRAVQRAHEGGILHRDLKPSNVLIDRDHQPHVTDFGLAKRVEGGSSLTGTGAILGTPTYMSPEQAAGSRGVIGPASDVYSLGVILYELITGRPPFQAPTPVDTIFAVLEQEPLPPHLMIPKVDRELEMICLKCLQKPADLRYAGAAQLADDLDAFLQGEPTSVRSSGLRDWLSRWFRETHHAAVLENWGVLWMWHSLTIMLICVCTSLMYWRGVTNHYAYLALWSISLVVWGLIFLALRRRIGPVTFVERQIVHMWAGGVIASIIVFVVEVLLDLKPLILSPVLAIFAGMVFLAKAGVLSGQFYWTAFAMFATAVIMSLLTPDLGVLFFGGMSAICFFFPGLKYYRQRVRAER